MTFAIVLALVLWVSGPADSLKPPGHPPVKKVWAEMVGQWRVSGQPKRGSSAGAWTTSGKRQWDIGVDGEPVKSKRLRLTLATGPKAGVIEFQADQTSGEFKTMKFLSPKGDERQFERLLQESSDRFVYLSTDSKGVNEERWTFQQRSRDRWLVLLEGRKTKTGEWSRIVEIGLTRDGTSIALGDGQPKCIVTGGQGTISVNVGGKSYFVCCSGCREALLDDPQAFIGALKPSRMQPIQPEAVNP